MKRTISLLLSALILILLLPGCAQFAPTEQESRTPMFQPTPTPVQTDPPADPTEDNASSNETSGESEGVLADLVSFTEFPEGNYLADTKFDTDEFLPDYDVDISFLHLQSTTYKGICTTEDTIYFFTQPAANASCFLHFTDIASGVTMPLCSKPECTHKDNACNAYLAGGMDVYGLRIYEGKIYWMACEDYGLKLMRMNVDGTDREVMFALDYNTYKELTRLGTPTWVIHRGYIYIAGTDKDYASTIEPIQFRV